MLPTLLLPTLLLQTPAPDRSAVEKPIHAYFRYHQTGDPKGLEEAFHAEALLQWAKDGQRQVLTQAEWRKRAEAQQAAGKGKPRPEVRCQIVSLDITGDAAAAKVILDYPTFRFIDHMHLIRLQDGWKVVDKVYHRVEGRH